MVIILEFLQIKEEFYILIYCFIILWINIEYLIEHKKLKEGLSDIDSEEEFVMTPSSISVMLFILVFNFIRRWLVYLLAVAITGNLFVIIIAAILFALSLYDSLFNYSLEKVKNSKIGLDLVVIDTIAITGFVIYLFILLIN
ncbi:hypothetical protein [Sporosarcina jiandibaonis]|uniref:hypothetical protein n=1 Tax=Sporosarcina jiandibaonis TaxID=2715535 RepID=UPI0031B59EF3